MSQPPNQGRIGNPTGEGPAGGELVPRTPSGAFPDAVEREIERPLRGVISRQVDPNVRGYVDGDPQNFDVAEAKVETSRYNEAAVMELKIIDHRGPTPDPLLGPLDTGSQVYLTVNGKQILVATVQQSYVATDGLIHVTAYDRIRRMKNDHVTGGYYTDTTGEKVFDAIATNAGIPHESDISEALRDRAGVNTIEIAISDNSVARALEQVTQASGGYWWIRRDNTLMYSDRLPTQTINLELVKEAFAGEAQPPYQKVVVTGKPQGDSGNAFSNKPVRGTAGSGRPVRRYKTNSVNTNAGAEAVAQNLLEKYQNQNQEGTIAIPGRADIRPMDIVVMPNIEGDSRLNGENYYVSALTHRLSASEGWVTEITAGGLPAKATGGSGDPPGEDALTAAQASFLVELSQSDQPPTDAQSDRLASIVNKTPELSEASEELLVEISQSDDPLTDGEKEALRSIAANQA